jgi:hypothetical protein
MIGPLFLVTVSVSDALQSLGTVTRHVYTVVPAGTDPNDKVREADPVPLATTVDPSFHCTVAVGALAP